MIGALEQLVINHERDDIFTSNPDITFFETVYRRHVDFYKQETEYQIQNIGFGKTSEVILPKTDYINNITLSVLLPAVKCKFNGLTRRQVKEILNSYGVNWNYENDGKMTDSDYEYLVGVIIDDERIKDGLISKYVEDLLNNKEQYEALLKSINEYIKTFVNQLTYDEFNNFFNLSFTCRDYTDFINNLDYKFKASNDNNIMQILTTLDFSNNGRLYNIVNEIDSSLVGYLNNNYLEFFNNVKENKGEDYAYEVMFNVRNKLSDYFYLVNKLMNVKYSDLLQLLNNFNGDLSYQLDKTFAGYINKSNIIAYINKIIKPSKFDFINDEISYYLLFKNIIESIEGYDVLKSIVFFIDTSKADLIEYNKNVINDMNIANDVAEIKQYGNEIDSSFKDNCIIEQIKNDVIKRMDGKECEIIEDNNTITFITEEKYVGRVKKILEKDNSMLIVDNSFTGVSVVTDNIDYVTIKDTNNRDNDIYKTNDDVIRVVDNSIITLKYHDDINYTSVVNKYYKTFDGEQYDGYQIRDDLLYVHTNNKFIVNDVTNVYVYEYVAGTYEQYDNVYCEYHNDNTVDINCSRYPGKRIPVKAVAISLIHGKTFYFIYEEDTSYYVGFCEYNTSNKTKSLKIYNVDQITINTYVFDSLDCKFDMLVYKPNYLIKLKNNGTSYEFSDNFYCNYTQESTHNIYNITYQVEDYPKGYVNETLILDLDNSLLFNKSDVDDVINTLIKTTVDMMKNDMKVNNFNYQITKDNPLITLTSQYYPFKFIIDTSTNATLTIIYDNNSITIDGTYEYTHEETFTDDYYTYSFTASAYDFSLAYHRNVGDTVGEEKYLEFDENSIFPFLFNYTAVDYLLSNTINKRCTDNIANINSSLISTITQCLNNYPQRIKTDVEFFLTNVSLFSYLFIEKIFINNYKKTNLRMLTDLASKSKDTFVVVIGETSYVISVNDFNDFKNEINNKLMLNDNYQTLSNYYITNYLINDNQIDNKVFNKDYVVMNTKLCNLNCKSLSEQVKLAYSVDEFDAMKNKVSEYDGLDIIAFIKELFGDKMVEYVYEKMNSEDSFNFFVNLMKQMFGVKNIDTTIMMYLMSFINDEEEISKYNTAIDKVMIDSTATIYNKQQTNAFMSNRYPYNNSLIKSTAANGEQSWYRDHIINDEFTKPNMLKCYASQVNNIHYDDLVNRYRMNKVLAVDGIFSINSSIDFYELSEYYECSEEHIYVVKNSVNVEESNLIIGVKDTISNYYYEITDHVYIPTIILDTENDIDYICNDLYVYYYTIYVDANEEDEPPKFLICVKDGMKVYQTTFTPASNENENDTITKELIDEGCVFYNGEFIYGSEHSNNYVAKLQTTIIMTINDKQSYFYCYFNDGDIIYDQTFLPIKYQTIKNTNNESINVVYVSNTLKEEFDDNLLFKFNNDYYASVIDSKKFYVSIDIVDDFKYVVKEVFTIVNKSYEQALYDNLLIITHPDGVNKLYYYQRLSSTIDITTDFTSDRYSYYYGDKYFKLASNDNVLTQTTIDGVVIYFKYDTRSVIKETYDESKHKIINYDQYISACKMFKNIKYIYSHPSYDGFVYWCSLMYVDNDGIHLATSNLPDVINNTYYRYLDDNKYVLGLKESSIIRTANDFISSSASIGYSIDDELDITSNTPASLVETTVNYKDIWLNDKSYKYVNATDYLQTQITCNFIEKSNEISNIKKNKEEIELSPSVVYLIANHDTFNDKQIGARLLRVNNNVINYDAVLMVAKEYLFIISSTKSSYSKQQYKSSEHPISYFVNVLKVSLIDEKILAEKYSYFTNDCIKTIKDNKLSSIELTADNIIFIASNVFKHYYKGHEIINISNIDRQYTNVGNSDIAYSKYYKCINSNYTGLASSFKVGRIYHYDNGTFIAIGSGSEEENATYRINVIDDKYVSCSIVNNNITYTFSIDKIIDYKLFSTRSKDITSFIKNDTVELITIDASDYDYLLITNKLASNYGTLFKRNNNLMSDEVWIIDNDNYYVWYDNELKSVLTYTVNKKVVDINGNEVELSKGNVMLMDEFTQDLSIKLFDNKLTNKVDVYSTSSFITLFNNLFLDTISKDNNYQQYIVLNLLATNIYHYKQSLTVNEYIKYAFNQITNKQFDTTTQFAKYLNDNYSIYYDTQISLSTYLNAINTDYYSFLTSTFITDATIISNLLNNINTPFDFDLTIIKNKINYTTSETYYDIAKSNEVNYLTNKEYVNPLLIYTSSAIKSRYPSNLYNEVIKYTPHKSLINALNKTVDYTYGIHKLENINPFVDMLFGDNMKDYETITDFNTVLINDLISKSTYYNYLADIFTSICYYYKMNNEVSAVSYVIDDQQINMTYDNMKANIEKIIDNVASYLETTEITTTQPTGTFNITARAINTYNYHYHALTFIFSQDGISKTIELKVDESVVLLNANVIEYVISAITIELLRMINRMTITFMNKNITDEIISNINKMKNDLLTSELSSVLYFKEVSDTTGYSYHIIYDNPIKYVISSGTIFTNYYQFNNIAKHYDYYFVINNFISTTLLNTFNNLYNTILSVDYQNPIKEAIDYIKNDLQSSDIIDGDLVINYYVHRDNIAKNVPYVNNILNQVLNKYSNIYLYKDFFTYYSLKTQNEYNDSSSLLISIIKYFYEFIASNDNKMFEFMISSSYNIYSYEMLFDYNKDGIVKSAGETVNFNNEYNTILIDTSADKEAKKKSLVLLFAIHQFNNDILSNIIVPTLDKLNYDNNNLSIFDIVNYDSQTRIDRMTINTTDTNIKNFTNIFVDKLSAYYLDNIKSCFNYLITLSESESPSTSYTHLQQWLTEYKSQLPNVKQLLNSIYGLTNTPTSKITPQLLYNKYNELIITQFNEFEYQSDLLKFLIYYLIEQTPFKSFLKYLTSASNVEMYDNIVNDLTKKIDAINNKLEKVGYEETSIPYYSKCEEYIRNLQSRQSVGTVKSCWNNEIGNYLIDKIEFFIGDQLIDTLTSDMLHIYYKLFTPAEKQKGYAQMIGDVKSLTTYNTKPKDNYQLFIPLQFFFNRYFTSSLPMLSLINSFAKLKIKFKKFDELFYAEDDAIIPNVQLSNARIIVEKIIVNEDTRIKESSKLNRMLIDQHQYFNKTYRVNEKHIIEVKGRFYNPVKEMFVLVRMKDKHLDDYKFNDEDIVSKMTIRFNNQIREVSKDIGYYSLVHKSKHTSNINDGTIVYSFAIYPEDIQPSGSCNLSLINEVELLLEINKNISTSSELFITWIARNNNFINFVGGQGGLLYQQTD